MKVPFCHVHCVGEFSPWAKTFLGALTRDHVVDVSYVVSAAQFGAVENPAAAVVFLENNPELRQNVIKIRASGRPCLMVWLGKSFTKEDLVFASENRVYWFLEDPRADDPKVWEGLRRVSHFAGQLEGFRTHIQSVQSVLTQGEEDAGLKALIGELKPLVTKLERTGLYGEFIGEYVGAAGEEPRVPFPSTHGLADALLTVNDLERTGTLWVRGSVAGQEGKVQFLQGRLISAVAGSVHGVKALYRMFLWDLPRFLFNRAEAEDSVVEEHLNVSLKYLCAEAEAFRARFQTIRREVPPEGLELELEPGAFHAGAQLSPEDFATLASVVEFQTVCEVCDFNPSADVEIFEALIRLRKHNFIRVAVK